MSTCKQPEAEYVLLESSFSLTVQNGRRRFTSLWKHYPRLAQNRGRRVCLTPFGQVCEWELSVYREWFSYNAQEVTPLD
jgi:hypothetical protein